MIRFLPAALLLLGSAAATAATPERLVTVGGAVTEIVHALGAGERVVATDTTSTWPETVPALPKVGYYRQLSAEPIVALRPDLVIAIHGSGPAAALDQLRQVGLRVELVDDQASPAGVLAKIDRIATLLDLEPEGAQLHAEVEQALARTAARVAEAGSRPRVLFLMSAGRGAPMAAGTGTAAAGIVALAGGVNAIDGYQGYKPLGPEAAVLAAPDVLLAMAETVAALGGPEAFLDLPALRQTPAARAGRLVTMEGMLLLGFGPRTPLAVDRLASALHPELPASE